MSVLVRMKVTTKGAMYGQQNDIRVFVEGKIYEEGKSISPCLVKVFVLAGLAEIVNPETKMAAPPENKMATPPENKTAPKVRRRR